MALTVADRIKTLLSNNPNSFSLIGSHTQNSSLSSAVTVTLTSGANGLLVQCTGTNVRYTLDGTTPTSTTGFVLYATANPVLLLASSDDTQFKFIESAASAVLIYQNVRVGGV